MGSNEPRPVHKPEWIGLRVPPDDGIVVPVPVVMQAGALLSSRPSRPPDGAWHCAERHDASPAPLGRHCGDPRLFFSHAAPPMSPQRNTVTHRAAPLFSTMEPSRIFPDAAQPKSNVRKKLDTTEPPILPSEIMEPVQSSILRRQVLRHRLPSRKPALI